MDMSAKEAASLSAGVPRATLESSQQPTIKGLERDGELFRRHERLPVVEHGTEIGALTPLHGDALDCLTSITNSH